MDFSLLSINELIRPQGYDCPCGRHHRVQIDYLRIGAGAVRELPQAIRAVGGTKPFVVCDPNTRKAAWAQAQAALEGAGIPWVLYCFSAERLEPDEAAVGALTMAFDPSCDCVLGIGSGVINDCCKVLSHAVGVKQLILGTAPSMDGYASNSSSMIRERVKVSLYNACPAAILCDTDIVRQAPMRMLQAGLGDMLAKYIAACEWRISHLVTGEYYCPNVAGLMRASLARVVQNAPGLATRQPEAVDAVVEGLVLSGIAMSFAGISRPASGLEHYFSHLWEMMALDRGEKSDLHGIQVGVGTLLCLKLYDWIRTLQPDAQKARAHMEHFSDAAWQQMIHTVMGKAADRVIALEHTEYHKNDPEGQQARFARIQAHWEEIRQIMEEELPPTEQVAGLMRALQMPMTPEDLHLSRQDTLRALVASRDIRDKYLTSSMLWDMGLLDEAVNHI